MLGIEDLRRAIDSADDVVARALRTRVDLGCQAVDHKTIQGLPARDEVRERAIVERVLTDHQLPEVLVQAVWGTLFEVTRGPRP